jgi:hypothetical protein
VSFAIRQFVWLRCNRALMASAASGMDGACPSRDHPDRGEDQETGQLALSRSPCLVKEKPGKSYSGLIGTQ